MNIEDSTGMRPEMGDSTITLPITFDYSGGRKDTSKTAKVWSIILAVVGILIFFGTLFGNAELIPKIIISSVVLIVFSTVIRFFLLKEKEKKEAMKSIIHTDYKLAYKDIWGIYKVERIHPHICRFRNGKSGIYIRLNKDVILGKYSEAEYEHYEAIADAYNLAGAGKVQMIHVDYMDNVGTDDRLESSFRSLEDVSNPDLRDLLTDIFSYQQENISRRVSTFDVYVFLWTGNDRTAWNSIQRIINCFLEANYRSYQILDERDLRELTKIVFNLNDFSVSEASAETFSTGDSVRSPITAISLTNADGTVVKLGKTKKEKEDEEKARILEEEARKRVRGKKSVNKKDSDDDDELFKDIF